MSAFGRGSPRREARHGPLRCSSTSASADRGPDRCTRLTTHLFLAQTLLVASFPHAASPLRKDTTVAILDLQKALVDAKVPFVQLELRNMKDERIVEEVGHPSHVANMIYECSVASGLEEHFSADFGMEIRASNCHGEPCAVIFDSTVAAADCQTHQVVTWGLFGPLGRPMLCGLQDTFEAPRAGSIRVSERIGPHPDRLKRLEKFVYYPNLLHKTKRTLPKRGGKFDNKTTHACLKHRIGVVERVSKEMREARHELRKASGWRFEATMCAAPPAESLAAFNELVDKGMWNPETAVPGSTGIAVELRTIADVAKLTAVAARQAIQGTADSTRIKGSIVHRKVNVALFNCLGISTCAHQTASNLPFSCFDELDDDETGAGQKTRFIFDFSPPSTEVETMHFDVDKGEDVDVEGRLVITPDLAAKLPSSQAEACDWLDALLHVKEIDTKRGTRFYAYHNDDKGNQITNKASRKELVLKVFDKLKAPMCWMQPKMKTASWVTIKELYASFDLAPPPR